MPRYKLTIEYDGTPFLGWQRQAGDAPTIQGAIEAAVKKFSGDVVTLHAAGRTDTGVHATGQVAHVDLTKQWDAARVREAINFHLKPAPVAVLSCDAVSDDFHARFSATKRVYRYRILTRRAPVVLDRDRVWWIPTPLDAIAMHEAAQSLVGDHDFTTFRAAQCQAKSPVKTLDSFSVERVDDEIHCCVESRSFLHHQVRSMVGSLKLVGAGQWTSADLQTALAAKNRTACGTVAPACGLYLVSVRY